MIINLLPRLRSDPLGSERKDDSDELDETVVHGPGSTLESRVLHTSLKHRLLQALLYQDL